LCINFAIFVYEHHIIMRTNIELDDVLVKEAMSLTKLRTKKEMVNFALDALIKKIKKQELASLWGSNIWEGDLNQMRIDEKTSL
jgi:Arc/MetJ family transcription regulator